MSKTIRVTTTPATVLRHSVELAERRDGEDQWEMQARTLEELGYRIVGKDAQAQAVAAELRAIARGIDPSSEGCHKEDADLLLRRAAELDPQGGQS